MQTITLYSDADLNTIEDLARRQQEARARFEQTHAEQDFGNLVSAKARAYSYAMHRRDLRQSAGTLRHGALVGSN